MNPLIKTEFISETHVRVGTIISFFFLFLFKDLNIDRVIKLADDPEFTKTENLVPSHLDHLLSNSLTFEACVKTIFFFF